MLVSWPLSWGIFHVPLRRMYNRCWWVAAAAAAAKLLQSCPTLCDPIDSSPLGSSVSGILQARILEWVAISFSNAWKWKAKVKSLNRAWLLATPWTAAYQAPPSMGFPRQEYWSGVPLPSPVGGWSAPYMPVKSIVMMFSIFLLLFWLVVFFILESGMLKLPMVAVGLSFCLHCSRFCFIILRLCF